MAGPEDQPTGKTEVARPVSLSAGLVRNPVSLIGAILVTLALANIIFLLLIGVLVQDKPYVGIFTFVVFPAILLLGLFIIPLGMLLERYRRRKLTAEEILPYPTIDLNQPAQRRVFAYLIGFFMLLLVVSAVLAYQAYHFTDSVAFCGLLCHQVMKPQFVASHDSPHSRVQCSGCHVGYGARSFFHSKLAGVFRVYAVWRNAYPRPIPDPIKDRGSIEEVCERCHWPARLFGVQLRVFRHFGYDKDNTLKEVALLINIGGGSPHFGSRSGIHWHMNIADKIWYVTKDEQGRVIPWVRMRDSQGRVTEYLAKNAAMTTAEIARAPRRLMDCISCHNRPSHDFLPPDASVDQSLAYSRLDRSLPFIKRQAVQALTKTYRSSDEAREGIATGLDAFYRAQYPQIYGKEKGQIEAAIAEVQRIYERSFFPYMRVDWHTYPNNIGHLYYLGCFRCHDGNHVSSDGRVIRQGCDVCHTFLSAQIRQPSPSLQGFEHPIDLKLLAGVPCSTCHSGGVH